MSESIQGPAPSADVTATSQETTEGAQRKANGGTPQFIRSVAELREKSPELYKATMEGIAMNIIQKMRRHAERMKRLMREGREQR